MGAFMLTFLTNFLGDKVKMVVLGVGALVVFLLGFIIGAWMGGTTVYIYTEDGKKTEVKWDDDQEKDLPTIIREGFDKGARSPLTGHHSDNPPQ